MAYLIWSFLLLSFSLMLIIYASKREIIARIGFILALAGIVASIVNFITHHHIGVCSIIFGLYCMLWTYQDNKDHPVSKGTNTYISQLQGYVAGVGFILYGLMVEL